MPASVRSCGGGEIVHHHEVARTQGRQKDLFEVEAEDLRIGGPIQGQAGGRTVQPQGPDQGGALPVAVRGVGMQALAFERPSAQAGHVGFGPGFVEEDQAGRVEGRLLAEPPAAGLPDVGTVLFAGPECLFLYVSPIRCRT